MRSEGLFDKLTKAQKQALSKKCAVWCKVRSGVLAATFLGSSALLAMMPSVLLPAAIISWAIVNVAVLFGTGFLKHDAYDFCGFLPWQQFPYLHNKFQERLVSSPEEIEETDRPVIKLTS